MDGDSKVNLVDSSPKAKVMEEMNTAGWPQENKQTSKQTNKQTDKQTDKQNKRAEWGAST